MTFKGEGRRGFISGVIGVACKYRVLMSNTRSFVAGLKVVWTSDFGAKGAGADAQNSSRERLKEMLASKDKPVAEGVAVMRRMEGIGGPA